MAAERIQKILSKFGIASRRRAEEMITEGLVTVNGQVATVGQKADLETDSIKVSGKLLTKEVPSTVYLAFHKPKGVISTLEDPEGRPTIAGYLTQLKTKVYPVGRLDFNSDGLIILTNDGDLVEQIQKSPKIPRVYHVKVKGHPRTEELDKLRRGGRLEGRLISPYRVKIAKRLENKSLIEVVLVGSGSFDLKTFFEHKGFLVEKMTRVAIGQIQLKGIEPGQYRMLEKTQVEALVQQPDLGLLALDREDEDRIEKKEKEENRAEGGPAPKRAFRRDDSRGARAPRGRSDRTAAGAGADRGSRAPMKGKDFIRKFGRDDRKEGDAPPKRGSFGKPRNDDDAPDFSAERADRPAFGDRGPRRDERGPRPDSRGPRGDRPAFSKGPRPMGDRPAFGKGFGGGPKKEGGYGRFNADSKPRVDEFGDPIRPRRGAGPSRGGKPGGFKSAGPRGPRSGGDRDDRRGGGGFSRGPRRDDSRGGGGFSRAPRDGDGASSGGFRPLRGKLKRR